jgi:SAM-dependent methyltransferase
VTPAELHTAFTAAERDWQSWLGKLRDVVRQELVTRQLGAELPPPPVPVIDLGCGQGTQALRLARRGYQVTGVDASADLLARFERDLAAEPAEVRARVRVERGLIEHWAERTVVSPVAAVLCHGVLGCAEAFGSDQYANRIGVAARADRLADLTGLLARVGLELTAWYGVRVFTDIAASDANPPEGPAELEALLDCEERAGRTDPYRRVAAMAHLIARRPA